MFNARYNSNENCSNNDIYTATDNDDNRTSTSTSTTI